MNRSLLKSLVATVVLLALPYVATAAALPPHDTTNYVSPCGFCHIAFDPAYGVSPLPLGSASSINNACLSCHRPGMSAPSSGPITAFTPADFANPLGTYTSARPKVLFQTSHNWNGSDNVPLAGALPPVSGSPLNGSKITGVLACVVCHDPHNNSGNASSGPGGNHLLRESNTNDTMCLDCHRQRNTTTHLTGTHPININLATSVGVANPPTSPNPSNPTATPKLMVNGNIGCTTCHGVHGSDSNSSTFDNISTLRGQAFRQLSTSKGYLLRAGLRGGTPTAVNACTTCHVNKTSHNGASQNVQCSDCHGGHVDTADGSQPNVYLIKRFINISTVYGAVRNKKVFFQYTGSQMNFVDVNGTGVCQACHQVPTTGIASDGTPLPPGHGTGDCMACHQHSAGKGSFSGGCTTCHGYPPQDNTVGGPTGKALGYGLDESTTKHLKHAGGNTNYTIACTECHYSPINDPNASNHGSHKNGSFQDVFQAGSGSVARLFGANPTYNATSRKCNNVYCHSTGAPNGVLGFKSYSTPAWVSGSATCNLCHDASPTTNAHQAHITVGIGCQNCHNATTNNGTTIANKANHANGTKDIQFYSQTLTNINSAKGGLSLCSTVYCHSNGKGVYAPPTWTSVTGKCGICHGADRAPIISTGAHFAHMSSVYGPKLDKLPAATLTPTPSAPACATCHTTFPADHLNGSVQSPSNCAAACHPNGTGTATWTSGTRIPDCLLCHGGTTQSYIGGKFAPPRVNFPTTGHGQFPVTVGSTTKITCTGCHDSNAPHIGVPGGTTRLIGGDNNTICANCHNNPAIVATPTRQNMPTHFTNFSGASRTPIARSLCVTCHDTHGTSNAHMIKTEIAFINTTTWTVGFDGTNFVNTTTNRGLCQVCHTKTNHWRAGVQDTSGHPNSGCLGCHDHKAALGAFAPVGGSCNGCHGYPPVPRNVAVTFGRFNNYSTARFEDYSGGGGAHTVAQHVSPTAKASQAWTNCGMCHDNGNSHLMQTPVNTHVSNVTIKVDPKYRFSNASLITYTGAKLVNPPNNKTGSCFNVSCHIQQSPKWSTEK